MTAPSVGTAPSDYLRTQHPWTRPYEYEVAVDDRAHNPDIAYRSALYEGLKERNESLDAIGNTGAVLGVPVPGVGLDSVA